MKKQILTIVAAATLAAFINPALASEVEQIECNLYPVDRYSMAAEEGEPVEQTATECVARHANVRLEQVTALAVDLDEDKVLVKVIFSHSTKTFLVTDKELVL